MMMKKKTSMMKGGKKKTSMKKGGVKTVKKTSVKKYKVGDVKKYQPGGKKYITPFENYLKTPGSVPSDTTQLFDGSRNTNNPKLDKAYYDTYYAGSDKRRTGSDAVVYDSSGKRIPASMIKRKGGIIKKAKKSTMSYKKGGTKKIMMKGGAKKK